MLPFINIFGLKISMYGLLIVLGVAIGSAVAVFFPSKKGIPKQDVIFSICYAGIGAILGQNSIPYNHHSPAVES